MLDSLRTRLPLLAIPAAVLLLLACGDGEQRENPPAEESATRPSILLVTLDTTRADSIGPGAEGVETPAFDALAAKGRRFTRAYATAPQTLPSHASMMTGLYPAGHGVRENARVLPSGHRLLAEDLREAGYRTAAFVSAYPLDRRFGLARGFAVYDDELSAGTNERSAEGTTDRALAYLESAGDGPLFLWVHYFDPHHPYEPPAPFASDYADDPYRGEIAAMDRQLGRLVEAFEARVGAPRAIVVAGDHGEGLGDHGEEQHGHLLYEPTMHVPLVVAGPGVEPGVVDAPVSVRRVFHTVLDWAGLDPSASLREAGSEVVLGEAMVPFLQYGWQPQVMALSGATKAIHAGETEVYDLAADPEEEVDLAGEQPLDRELREALRDYPLPSSEPSAAPVDDEARRRLAALGYVATDSTPVVREDAPRPAEMTHLFDDLDRASSLFVSERWAEAIPVLETILEDDPGNLGTVLRLAAAHSALGNETRALEAFDRARDLAPDSPDVDHYHALHLVRVGDLEAAEPLLERSLAASPDRLPAIEALAAIRERQGKLQEALALRRRALALGQPGASELLHLGELAMAVRDTPAAIDAFERLRAVRGGEFDHHLELGVLYLDAGRLADAAAALDRVSPDHPGYPMALFKRAQVAVLLGAPDAGNRIEEARRHADETTRALIEGEGLFR